MMLATVSVPVVSVAFSLHYGLVWSYGNALLLPSHCQCRCTLDAGAVSSCTPPTRTHCSSHECTFPMPRCCALHIMALYKFCSPCFASPAPLTDFWWCGEAARPGGQPRANSQPPHAVLAGRPQALQYQLAPPSSWLGKWGIFATTATQSIPAPIQCWFFTKKTPSPTQNLKLGNSFPSQKFGATWKGSKTRQVLQTKN